ncbi:hypothetical protein evm_012936 [Chilo suppressalis]|nr:hypothetical protein evm_012936 [Chilo suppressalis]
MQQLPLACFLSLIRPPGVAFEDGYLQILPVDKAKCPFVKDSNDITFRLYTRHNPIMFQELKIDDDESLFASHINFHDPTVIYFSAFLEQPDDGSGLQVREAYMLRGDTNFIILDLSRLEAGPWYFTAAENTWYIGNFAAKFIDYLVSRGLDLKKTHLVGHSLGAQSAGVAGSALKSGRVSRITGLDPAFPLFDKLPLSQRLDPSDAEFVDVIHTDAGIFGYNRPAGHVDFYPNGGISPQPGCELEIVLHEQRLLNKCDGTAQPHGYYSFTLDVKNKTNNFEERLTQYFNHIDELKSNSDKDDIKTTIKVNTENTKEVTIETQKHKFDKHDKQNKTRKTSNNKERHVQKHIDAEFETLEELNNESNNFKREKRITLDNVKFISDDISKSNDEVTGNSDTKPHKREKRFISFFRNDNDENFLLKMLDFLVKNRKNVLPVVTVMREINTLVKNANGELSHFTKERNNYIAKGVDCPSLGAENESPWNVLPDD